MKKLIPAILFATAFLAFLQPVLAQNYQPFRKGFTYHYIAQDSIYSLRVDSVKVVAGDSVFVFNQNYKKIQPVSKPGCSHGHFNPRFLITDNNQFGSSMIKKQNGDYNFLSNQGSGFLLKTNATIGQNWVFNSQNNLVATLTSRSVETIQSISDSVLTFNISNGSVIKLSKNYGFIYAPNFIYLADPGFRLKTMTFYALPEKQLGTEISNTFKIFDFQIGDEFQTLNTFWKYGSPIPCTANWTKKKILTRNSNASSDTITYQIETQNLYMAFGNPSNLIGCTISADTILSPITIETLVVTKNYIPELNTLSNSFYFDPISPAPGFGIFNSKINLAVTNSVYNQRKKIVFFDTFYRPCSNTLEEMLDIDITTSYAVGLGKIGRVSVQPDGLYKEELECYTKGSETYGKCLTFFQIMANQKALEPAAIKAYPNPFTSEVALQFSSSFSAGKATVLVSNVLGQEVLKQEITVTPGLENRLEMSGLTKGIYVLKAEQHGKAFTTRLVKE